jgi:predicted NBD/HSP70 family sugar kinase
MPVASVLHILRTIKERGIISRTDLQQITGLSWGTVTNTTRELLNRNLIREEGALSTKAGRKPVQLALNKQDHCLAGVEIAPDRVRCLVLNLAGDLLWHGERAAIAGEAPEAVLEATAELVNRALAAPNAAARTCMGVGVAVPGALDVKRGIVRYAPRMPGWNNVGVLSFLRSHINVTVRLEHNPNCLALAERWFGAAGEAENVLCIHLGEGVGMGILINGEIFRGGEGLAGEFGHTTLDPAGPPCACGDRGCVEAYCSASALLAHTKSHLNGDASTAAGTVEELAALAAQGNHAAKATFELMGEKLGIGVANLIDLFNPDVVILAGRSTVASSHFLPALQREVDTHAWRQSGKKLHISSLGERATAMGACGMILQGSFNHELVTAAASMPA